MIEGNNSHYNKKLQPFAKALRSDMTLTEVLKAQMLTRDLETHGFNVLKYTYKEVLRHIEHVQESIANWIDNNASVPPPAPASGGKEKMSDENPGFRGDILRNTHYRKVLYTVVNIIIILRFYLALNQFRSEIQPVKIESLKLKTQKQVNSGLDSHLFWQKIP